MLKRGVIQARGEWDQIETRLIFIPFLSFSYSLFFFLYSAWILPSLPSLCKMTVDCCSCHSTIMTMTVKRRTLAIRPALSMSRPGSSVTKCEFIMYRPYSEQWLTQQCYNSNLVQKHPFSLDTHKSQQTHSEPLLLPPQSILNKSGKISSSPNVLLLQANDNEVRRPSLVKFSNNTSNNTVFYDAVTEQQEKRKKPSISAPLASSSRRPSLISRISSAYTNKVADIPFHEIDPFDQHLLQQGIVLCANVLSAHQEIRKKALKWRKYRAVITQSGYLELYHLCVHQERNVRYSHVF